MDSTAIFVLFGVFAVLLILGVPIIYAIGLSAFFAVSVNAGFVDSAFVIAQRLATGMDSFALLAIPFFIIAGNIMNRGGLAIRLIDFAKLLGGQLPGALAHCNVIANMLFGALSGSAVAAGAAVGGVMSPIQKKEGYDPVYSACVNITSCPTGLLIPPSNALIVFSLVTGGTSVSALFLAGYLPGILMGLGIMVVAAIIAKKKGYPTIRFPGASAALKITWAAIPSLGLIVVIMGGIVGGFFTPTEAAAIAVVYTLFLTLVCYRELSVRELPSVFLESALTSSIVLILIGASKGMAYAMSDADVPYIISEALLSLSDNKIVILLIINVLLLVVGTFMDMTPAILIFTPILFPITQELGIDPVHFGIIMVFNLCIGICTPPVGSALFVGCSVANVSINSVLKPLLPFYVVLFITLMMVTYIPALSLTLPSWVMGYIP
jgi:TRAP transporter, DctM subunit